MFNKGTKSFFWRTLSIGLALIMILTMVLSYLQEGKVQAAPAPLGVSSIQVNQPTMRGPSRARTNPDGLGGSTLLSADHPPYYLGHGISHYQADSPPEDGGSVRLTLNEIKTLTQQTSNKTVNQSTPVEVNEVSFWLNPGRDDWIWGVAEVGSEVEIVTPRVTISSFAVDDPECWGCWNIDEPVEIIPGDEITVTAGAGTQPVTFTVPAPLTVEADTKDDIVSGQIGGRNEEWLHIHGWWEEGFAETTTDPDGSFSVNYMNEFGVDIPRAGEGFIVFNDWYNEDTTEVRYHQYFRSTDLVLRINPSHNWIEGNYKPGYTVSLELLDSADVHKADFSMVTEEIEWWNGDTGFFSFGHLWDPQDPTIEFGDRVLGQVEDDTNIIDQVDVKVGTITGEVDVGIDRVTGTIEAPWTVDDPDVDEIEVYCSDGGGRQTSDWVKPNGVDEYLCEFDDWDIQAGEDVWVSYHDPEGHKIFGVFFVYSNELLLNINYGHDWIEGGYAPGYDVTLTVYESDQTTLKATATITTGVIPWWGSGTGFSTNYEDPENPWAWDPERPNIQPYDWVIGEVDVDGTIYNAAVQVGLIEGEVDLDTDRFTGSVYAPWLDPDTPVEVECHPWGAPGGAPGKGRTVLPDGVDTFTCDWSGEWDIKPNQDIGVSYREPEGHWIYGVFQGFSNAPILRVHYDHDWIDGPYQPGHSVYLEVRDSQGGLRASTTVETRVFDEWGGWTGFATHDADWHPRHPDIQPGDTVYAQVDGGAFSSEVIVGEITGDADLDFDVVSGSVNAMWLLDPPYEVEEVVVGCYIWVENGINIYDTVIPNGIDTYTCNFGAEGWDLIPGTNLMVAYIEPDGHEIVGDFHPPAPHLKIEKWFIGDGSPGVGGNAAFLVQYANHGDLPADDFTITDTLVGMTYIRDTSGFPATIIGNQVIWDFGILEPGDWIWFVLFVEVTAPVDSPISNTVEITTTGPDMGEPWEKISVWEGTVAANDTHLNVGKWPWTWNPAAGEDFIYTLNVCNNGSTSSSTISLTDTLPDNTTFVSWWGGDVGWSEVNVVGQTVELAHTCVSPGTCSEVYIRVTVDPGAVPGDEIFNEVEISADNDIETDDNYASVTHHVGEPYTDLSIGQGWHSGVLTPGGEYRYGIYFRNDGNTSVSDSIEVKATLPEGTSFIGWGRWGSASVDDPVVDGQTVTWQVNVGTPGYDGTIEVWVAIDPGTTPGTELEHLAEIDIEDDNADNNSSVFTEMVNAHGPNLRVHKWGDWHGDPTDFYAWYEVRAENIGDQTVDDVVITDAFPEGMTMRDGLQVHFWEWSECTENPDGFTCTLDRLEPGWNMGVNFSLSPDSPDPGLVYINTATVAGMGGSDINPDDNTVQFELASGPDMYIEKTLDEGNFQLGTQVTYLLHFGNHQNTWWWGMQGNAIITDWLPEGMTFVSAHLRWCDEQEEWACEVTPEIEDGGRTVIWDLYPIGTQNWNEILLTVEIDETVQSDNPLINEVSITSEHEDDVDPYPDNNFSIHVPELDLMAPGITSANQAAFIVGSEGSFTVTTTGNPVPGIEFTGDLPSGVTLMDNDDGTATLSGIPGAGTAGEYVLEITASNGVLPNATQSFTLQIVEAPTITSVDQTAFTVGSMGSFIITTTGTPTAGVTFTGALPSGVTLVDNEDGTATLSGVPGAGTAGEYVLEITASNGVSPDAVQSFTLTVESGAFMMYMPLVLK